MPSYVLGMNAKLFYGAEDAALAACTEITNVRDVTVNLEAGEADVTTRGNSGWRATAATLRECTVEFQMLWNQSDSAFQAIRNAYLNAGLVRLAPLTGALSTAGSEGPFGNFSITSFSRKESLEEGVTVDVTAKLVDREEWIEDGAQGE